MFKINLKNSDPKKGMKNGSDIRKKEQNGKSVLEVKIKEAQIVCELHNYECIELPQLANGLAAHNDYKCGNCYMRPIIGACFICADCPHFSMC